MNILVIEDSPTARTLIQEDLRKYADVTAIGNVFDAEPLLSETPFDCIVSDLSLGDKMDPAKTTTPEQTLEWLASRSEPVVVITGHARGPYGTRLGEQCARLGLHEFVDKFEVIRDPLILWQAILRETARRNGKSETM